MKQPNRLEGDLPPEFSTPLINRKRPIRFRVDGIVVDALEGDSVLSALLAKGITIAGLAQGHAVALDASTAPPVRLVGNGSRSDLAMPMALCPACDGMSIETLAPKKTTAPIETLTRFWSKHSNTLGINFDAELPQPGPWIDASPTRRIEADVAIVGGGLAGLSAALEAAGSGRNVVLLEREPMLGGMAVFYGKSEGELAPEEAVAELVAAVVQNDRISILSRCEAFDMHENRLRAVAVVREHDVPHPEHVEISAATIVLATGMEEQLPAFPGNRLPGVIGAGFAWRMARQFNVWLGQDMHLHTATNVGYRMALLGSMAARKVNRASDPRQAPRTRFIEFCKAYGFRLGWGMRIAHVRQSGKGLAVTLADMQSGVAQPEPVEADAVVVSGGWQPALGLWMRAAGSVDWDNVQGRLAPLGAKDGVLLAGSVAGFESTSACMASGKAAGSAEPASASIADPRIDELFESRDGALPVSAPTQPGQPPAYLSPTLHGRMSTPRPGLLRAMLVRETNEETPDIRAFELPDIVGMVIDGRLPQEEVPTFCAQWSIAPELIKAGELPAPQEPETDGLPDYLMGRYGATAAIWSILPSTDRTFDPGCLIFRNTDETNPLWSIGTVVSGAAHNVVALMARTALESGDMVYIRDGSTCTAARLGTRRSGS